MRQRSWRRVAAVAVVMTAGVGVAGCTVAGGTSADAEVITVGYQSKTINTVTAGTLLRARGYFEERLRELGKKTGTTYEVQWQDYDTGAPITAQMVAGKIDIGSMGDYPLLINGSQAGTDEDGTSMVSVTGYNARGALNGVVVEAGSDVQRLQELKGRSISASVGSAGHGTLVQALDRAGIAPDAVSIENQDPSVGASALQAGSVDAVSQFVAWPGLLAYRDGARLIYDGGELGVPTLHGVVTRREFSAEQPQVLEAFLAAQIDATEYLQAHPLQASKQVAEATGLPAEVVYLYNGRNGIATFDPTIKKFQVEALRHDVPFLKSIGVMSSKLDLARFVDDSYIRKVYGSSYQQDAASTANPAQISGRDQVCDAPVDDPATAGEVWVQGEPDTRPVADPTCLLRNVAAVQSRGESVRAAYVPDAVTGTRWLADHMVWLREGGRFYPFATAASAERWQQQHAGATSFTWKQALESLR
jgi:NitT/TauT family transport system substrate-binding protein